jgi:hypothetical protein
MQGLLQGGNEQHVHKPPWGGVVTLPGAFCTPVALRTILTQAVQFATCWKTLTAHERHDLQPHVLAHSMCTGVTVAKQVGPLLGGTLTEEEEDCFVRAIGTRCGTCMMQSNIRSMVFLPAE